MCNCLFIGNHLEHFFTWRRKEWGWKWEEREGRRSDPLVQAFHLCPKPTSSAPSSLLQKKIYIRQSDPPVQAFHLCPKPTSSAPSSLLQKKIYIRQSDPQVQVFHLCPKPTSLAPSSLLQKKIYIRHNDPPAHRFRAVLPFSEKKNYFVKTGTENARNSVLSHSVEDLKKFWIPVRTIW